MMKAKILAMLRETDDFVSGQQLCDTFGVSRTAVWKAINQLKKEGYVIEAVNNKGYHLRSEKQDELYNEAELTSRMDTRWMAKELRFFREIDSTNAFAKQMGEQEGHNGMLIVADKQTVGKGRRGRAWESPAGKNIYFTLLLHPEILPNHASMLTLVMAMAVAKGIPNCIPGIRPAIKWPNDIIVDKKKVCGILTEMSMSVEMDAISYLVIGVGINVCEQSFPQELLEKATSLEEASGQKVSRTILLAEIIKAFEQYYECFLQTQDLSALKEEYNSMLVNVGNQVRILDPKGEFEAVAEGIDATGQLLVTLPDGTRQEIYAGEVSVRGIGGYI